jgi:hypothetical protein
MSATFSSGTTRVLVNTAAVAVFATLVLLSLRTLVSVDLGYNLEYGQRFLETGRIVDHVDFLYTLPSPDLPAERRPAPGPGSWYDETGRYRFVNANWLSQVALAAVYAAWGSSGLVLLNAVLSLTVFVLMFLAMLRLGVTPLIAAMGLGLYALVTFWRFTLRPEQFGFACLAAQLVILAPVASEAKRAAELRWPAIAGLAGLQILFVNSHSYFMLGIAVTGAIFAEYLVRWLFQRDPGGASSAALLRRAAVRTGTVVVALSAACLANPWTWRVAILPAQTLIYLNRHGISRGGGPHPWSRIAELHVPFPPSFPCYFSDYAVIAVLVLWALAAVTALIRFKLSFFFIIMGMTLVGLSMVRNMAPAATVAVPVALAALSSLPSKMFGLAFLRRSHAVAGAAAVIVLSAVWSYHIVTNRFYLVEEAPMRFGFGFNRAWLPLGAAEWLSDHLPRGRIWCDTNSSSALRFFTDPPPDLPILTNQWAYPPSVMNENQMYRANLLPFERAVRRYGVDAVVLRPSNSRPLFKRLARSPDWMLVHVEGVHVVFLRANRDLTAPLVGLALANFAGDKEAYVKEQRAVDPILSSSLVPVGRVLVEAGVSDLAVSVFEAVVSEDAGNARMWAALGSAYLARAKDRRRDGDPEYRKDLMEARIRFRRVLEFEPDDGSAVKMLEKVEELLVGDEHPKAG